MTLDTAKLLVKRGILSECLNDMMTSSNELETVKSIIIKWLSTEILEIDKQTEKLNIGKVWKELLVK